MWTDLFVWICFQGCHWPRPFQYYRNTAESSKMSRCSTANKYGSAIIMSMNIYVVRFLSKSLKYMDYLYPYLTCFSPSNRCHSATTSFSTWLRMELNCCLTPAIRDWRWEVTWVWVWVWVCVWERDWFWAKMCLTLTLKIYLHWVSVVFAGNWSVRFGQSETEILVSHLV